MKSSHEIWCRVQNKNKLVKLMAITTPFYCIGSLSVWLINITTLPPTNPNWICKQSSTNMLLFKVYDTSQVFYLLNFGIHSVVNVLDEKSIFLAHRISGILDFRLVHSIEFHIVFKPHTVKLSPFGLLILWMLTQM